MSENLNTKPPKITTQALEKLYQELLEDSQLNTNFMALAVSACIIATLGLLMNSTAVIIGAMIIAPLMMPLRGLALGALEADLKLLGQSLSTLAIATIVAILISGSVGRIFGVPALSFGSEILARTQPNLADLGVALAAGGISGFAKIRPRISDALAGTAIAVALMPPLCVVGISLSQWDLGAAGGAFLLYLTNFLGITLACMLVYIWGGYALDIRKMSFALLWFMSLTGALIFPLFVSFINLIEQAKLQGIIKELLTYRTVTFGQQTELNRLQVQWSLPWSKKPSKLTLFVQETANQKSLTPNQVKKVEEFLEEKLNKSFKITVLVSPYLRITADEPKAPQPFPTPLLNPSNSINTDDLIIAPTPDNPTTTTSPNN
ncbi:conserved hypothetical protein [Gloeothece citriformis PCC 7424]|uniref:Hydrophobic domain protein n=1 Tax=Gloeothece citriformis (strain PCC 7424) TaxID=65393 RepID=B7KAW5_GLOC7|nr:DUF389 domain-containing protein [Gloeothece citriformis]ACK70075.1 conserved hypothetical protein [Gloeothece citriformis PCC 7424]